MTIEEITRQVIQEEDKLLQAAEAKKGITPTERMLIMAEVRLTTNKIISRLKEDKNNGNKSNHR